MLPMKHLAVLALSVALVAGCGAEDDAGAPATTEPAPEWSGVPELRPEGGTLEVDGFRSYAEAVDEAWERDPEALAREYLRLEDGVLTVDDSRVTLLRDGLEDDSVRAERWVLDLERDGDRWTLAAARWEQRCHQGRGHQDFGNELCL